MAKAKRKARITNRRMAGPEHAVVEVTGGGGATHRTSPCGGCPWRVDQAGVFPAEAFRISAHTAYDQSFHTFACHESGSDKPATCAGFLLCNAKDNIGVRLATAKGNIRWADIHDGGVALYDSYRAMAVANGVDPSDPALERCRP